jgi:hypothetical protein
MPAVAMDPRLVPGSPERPTPVAPEVASRGEAGHYAVVDVNEEFTIQLDPLSEMR